MQGVCVNYLVQLGIRLLPILSHASAMNRLLRRSRSADLDSPSPDGRPLFASPVVRTPSATDRGEEDVAAGAPAGSSSSQARGIQFPGASAPTAALSRPPETALRTAGSTPVPHPAGAQIPAPDAGTAGPSSSAPGLPSSIAHLFHRKLDLDAGNYSKWRQHFYVICSRHNVQHHLDVPADPRRQSAIWRNDDLTIVLWMYEVIAEDLQDVVMSPTSTAYDVWVQLHMLFRDNTPGRAIILEAEFHNLVQGDMSVAEYNRCLKTHSAALGKVGFLITDQALNLQLICGLSRRFQVMATLLPMQNPFPTFVQARSCLLMEELSANKRARLDGQGSGAPTALAIGPAPDRGVDRGPAPSGDKGKGPVSSPTSDTRSRGRGRPRPWRPGLFRRRLLLGLPPSRWARHYLNTCRPPLAGVLCAVGHSVPPAAPATPRALVRAERRYRPRATPSSTTPGVPRRWAVRRCGRPLLGAVPPAERRPSQPVAAAARRRRARVVPRHGRHLPRRWTS
ncbi:uncharacterized protein LOC125555453 [Triticum urartu]|uniref:uncharacterized protein LOC125555453 n=1 Tax=Triticum urartu TaxID=4572 RepID=UPI002042E3F5|nr:uncharacterized protein LOC125555453 [Triticum urartu]